MVGSGSNYRGGPTCVREWQLSIYPQTLIM